MHVGDNRKNSWVSNSILYKTSFKCCMLLFRVLEHELIFYIYSINLIQQKGPRFVHVPEVRFELGVRSRMTHLSYILRSSLGKCS